MPLPGIEPGFSEPQSEVLNHYTTVATLLFPAQIDQNMFYWAIISISYHQIPWSQTTPNQKNPNPKNNPYINNQHNPFLPLPSFTPSFPFPFPWPLAPPAKTSKFPFYTYPHIPSQFYPRVLGGRARRGIVGKCRCLGNGRGFRNLLKVRLICRLIGRMLLLNAGGKSLQLLVYFLMRRRSSELVSNNFAMLRIFSIHIHPTL